jgi:DNA-binding response OmpR family regulator
MDAERTQSSRKRILVADDEPHIRRIVATLLDSASFSVIEAVDGTDAISHIDSGEPIDGFVLDLMMPGATGIEVLAHVRGHAVHSRAAVIILTAKGQDTDREAALAAGADDFLTKPFSPKKLLARIQEIVAER